MEARLFRLVMALKRKCFATETRIQEERSLSPAEFHGLLSLDGTAISGGDFAGNIGLSASRASRVAAKLMKKGFLDVLHDPADRRVVRLKLTRKGLSAKTTIEADIDSCEKATLSGLPSDQRHRVTQALEWLIKAM